MPTTKTTLLFAIIFFFSFGFGWAQTPSEPTLQQKLDEVAGKEAPAKKEKKTKNGKPAKTPVLDSADPNLSEHDKKVAMLARELELRKELKTLDEQKKKMFTPTEKQAESMVSRQEKNRQKAVVNQAQAIANARITGCEVGTVWVNPEAEAPHWVTNIYQSVMVRVINIGTLPIDEISGPKGIMVQNLCSRGAMTMTFFLGLNDADSISIPLTAISRTPDGGIATAQYNVNISRWNYYQRVDNQIWQIQLNRQQQVR